MLLVVDVGNTNIKLGLYKDENLIDVCRMPSTRGYAVRDYANLINQFITEEEGRVVSRACVCSVVKELTEVICRALLEYLKIPFLNVDYKTKTNIKNCLKSPKEVGADRIINALSAYNLYHQKTCVVVDFGTATSFDVVTSNGEFLGGIIAPGLGLGAKALSVFTSALPEITIDHSKTFIGRNTETAMLSGLVRGHAKMIDGLLYGIEQELGESVLRISTGGHSMLLSQYLDKPFDYINPNLTLEGLRLVSQWNKFKKPK